MPLQRKWQELQLVSLSSLGTKQSMCSRPRSHMCTSFFLCSVVFLFHNTNLISFTKFLSLCPAFSLSLSLSLEKCLQPNQPRFFRDWQQKELIDWSRIYLITDFLPSCFLKGKITVIAPFKDGWNCFHICVPAFHLRPALCVTRACVKTKKSFKKN